MAEKKLTQFEAGMLVAGAGLGTGILAIPFASSNLGIVQIAAAVITAYAISAVLHLLVADLVFLSAPSVQLMEIFKKHLFHGKAGKIASRIFFAVLIAVLLMNLTLYLTCAAEVMTGVFGMPGWAAKVVFYLAASAVVLPGLKVIGISEKYSMILIGGVIVMLSVLAAGHSGGQITVFSGSLVRMTALYSLCMFSFSALFSVPQIAAGLRDRKKVKRCVLAGIGTNAAITFIFTVIVLKVSPAVTKVATVGLSNEFGMAVKIACAVFVILAMLTSFWSISLAQLDIIREELKISRFLCWVCATLPVLLLAVILPFGYLSYIEVVGGAVAIIIALLVLPAYWNAAGGVRGGGGAGGALGAGGAGGIDKPGEGLILGRYARSKLLLLVLFVFYIIMAVFSFA